MGIDFEKSEFTEEQHALMSAQLREHHDCNIPSINVLERRGSPIAILRGYAFLQCCNFVIGMFALFGGNVAQFAVPYLIGVVVDSMAIQDWDTIYSACLIMLVMVIFSGICVWIRGTMFNTISERIAKQLRYDLFYFLINKDVAFFDEMKTGDILSRISSDTQVVKDGLSTNISMFVRTMVFIIATLIVLCLISWRLTLVTVCGVLPISLTAVFYGRAVRKLSEEV